MALLVCDFIQTNHSQGYVLPSVQAGTDPVHLTTVVRAHLRQHLSEYLHLGGIPDPLKYPELPLLRTLYDDVLYRDSATRHRIEEVRSLIELAFYPMSNPTSHVSFNIYGDK